MKKIGFVGAGNMASSLIIGLKESGVSVDCLLASATNSNGSLLFKQGLGVSVIEDNQKIFEFADIVVLAVKPNQIKQVLTAIPSSFMEGKLLVSVAAGITLSSIEAWAGLQGLSVIRAMPNTPSRKLAGMTAMYGNTYVQKDDRDIADYIMKSVGQVVWLDSEQQMDYVTAISGSGPAYFFLLMESMVKAGEQLGLPAHIVHTLVGQTAIGSSQLASEVNDFAQLRKEVTSPKGTTEAAIDVFERCEFQAIVGKAVQAASSRAQELAQMYANCE